MSTANPGAVPQLVHDVADQTLEVYQLDTSEATLLKLLKDIFENHWSKVQFGLLIEGSVLEISLENAPKKVSLYDGYLTVDFGKWHMHLCIGLNKGSGCYKPTSPELAAHRRTKRAELYRKLNRDGEPVFWAMRLINGAEEQQLTVFLPSPLLTEEMNYQDPPDWSRLAVWDHLRKEYLGLSDPDPKDRLAKKFTHD